MTNTFYWGHELVRYSRLELGKKLVFTLGFLKHFLGSNVPDSENSALTVFKNDALETDLDLQQVTCVFIVSRIQNWPELGIKGFWKLGVVPH